MDVGLGVILILLAMPGVMVSLLLFEKFGSLIRWMRGDGAREDGCQYYPGPDTKPFHLRRFTPPLLDL